MINTPKSWTINDKNLANTYLNIANVLLVVKNYMKSHMDNVKNGARTGKRPSGISDFP